METSLNYEGKHNEAITAWKSILVSDIPITDYEYQCTVKLGWVCPRNGAVCHQASAELLY